MTTEATQEQIFRYAVYGDLRMVRYELEKLSRTELNTLGANLEKLLAEVNRQKTAPPAHSEGE